MTKPGQPPLDPRLKMMDHPFGGTWGKRITRPSMLTTEVPKELKYDDERLRERVRKNDKSE